MNDAPESRPRIALVADTRDWAFDRIASAIADHSRAHLRAQVFFMMDYLPVEAPERRPRLFEELFSGDFDLVHFFWRDEIPNLLEVMALDSPDPAGLDALERRFSSVPVTTSVHDHLFLEPPEVARRAALFGVLCAGYTVSSAKLDAIYRALPLFPPPDAVTADGVDCGFFRPPDSSPPRVDGSRVVVGWVGNSRWGMNIDGVDHKGVETIFRPALAALTARGVPVEQRIHDRNDAWLPFGRLPAFFQSLDVYVCVSDDEGTATPVLEAMATGLPVVSTAVGIVPDLFGPAQRQMLLARRTPAALAEKLEALVRSPSLRAELGRENLERVRAWTWERCASRWRQFFDAVLADAAHGTGRMSPSARARRRAHWAALGERVEVRRAVAREEQRAHELATRLAQIEAETQVLARELERVDGGLRGLLSSRAVQLAIRLARLRERLSRVARGR